MASSTSPEIGGNVNDAYNEWLPRKVPLLYTLKMTADGYYVIVIIKTTEGIYIALSVTQSALQLTTTIIERDMSNVHIHSKSIETHTHTHACIHAHTHTDTHTHTPPTHTHHDEQNTVLL